MSRSFILAVRFVLVAIFLLLLAYTAKAAADEVSPPRLVPCGMTNGEVIVPRVCVLMAFAGKSFVVMFSRDGSTVIMVMRIERDGSRTIVYQTAEPVEA